jgi:hypothetical protein
LVVARLPFNQREEISRLRRLRNQPVRR